MLTLKKNDVDNYVINGDVYERLGAIIGYLQVRDKKFMKREAFDKNNSGNYVLASWLLNYVPSLRKWEHKKDDEKLVVDMNDEERASWENWKKMSSAMAFPKEKIIIIG